METSLYAAAAIRIVSSYVTLKVPLTHWFFDSEIYKRIKKNITANHDKQADNQHLPIREFFTEKSQGEETDDNLQKNMLE